MSSERLHSYYKVGWRRTMTRISLEYTTTHDNVVNKKEYDNDF